ncbi:MAG: hypothetical protein ABSB42_23310, partial [Tepidisphaeraceae bacterium]
CLSSAFLRRLSSGGLVAGRRLSPCPHLVASHGLSHSESRTPCQERSPFSPVTFVPDDEEEIYPHASEIRLFFQAKFSPIH